MVLLLLLSLAPPPPDAPSRVDVLSTAQEHLAASDRPVARRELARAIELYPLDSALRTLLGVVEADEGDYERAEQALELEPDHYLGNVFPATLYARTTERFERPEARQVAERREFLLPTGVRPY